VRNIRLRTKFLLSLLAISAGLTAATLFVVSYSVQKRVRAGLREDLRSSVSTYQSFAEQRDSTRSRSAELLANLPNVRALMTTPDSATIQDASGDIWRLSGSDLLLMARRNGDLVALRTGTANLARDTTAEMLRISLQKGNAHDWWFGANHLFEVWIRPIYFGPASANSTIGYLAVGDEINSRVASDFSKIAGSEAAFFYGDLLVASSLNSVQQDHLLAWRGVVAGENSPRGSAEIQLGDEHFLVAASSLSPGQQSGQESPVSLIILKSLDHATAFLRALNQILLALGLISILAGSALVFLISDTFTRPLANLVGGVRALEQGDFRFPLESSSGDEVAEVTSAFGRMRSTLQETQREQKQLEERLRQAHKMEAIGRLAGGVAHDFNNLLTIIRGHSDLLLDRPAIESAQRRSLEQIQKAGNRAVAMTRQLLAFSRMQVLEPRVLDLNEVVAEMGKMLPRLIGEHIEYVFSPAANLSCVKADPGQIEQVIMNLMVNARDAMPTGGKIVVRTQDVVLDEAQARQHAPMAPGPYVLLSVSDTGHGMDAETKAHIFEPFFTTKEVGKGTGLGLATVYGVVKQSGGFIYVHSSPGQGATFEIYLPPAPRSAKKTEIEAPPKAIVGGSETILVVEDEAAVRDLACDFLRLSGYTVLEAQNGLEALEICSQRSEPIHLVISDMIMPKMGGAELATKLNALRPDTKVLLMSGYSDYSSGLRPSAALQVMILQKPFSRSSLTEKVREALGQSSLQEAAPQKG
jgi:signal transduction histidine kinase/ActR/RegA family two-component response regulator